VRQGTSRPPGDPRNHWRGERADFEVGPQGQALILELRRIQETFEQELRRMPAERRHAPDAPCGGKPAKGLQSLRPKRRRGVLSRAFGGGFGTPRVQPLALSEPPASETESTVLERPDLPPGKAVAPLGAEPAARWSDPVSPKLGPMMQIGMTVPANENRVRGGERAEPVNYSSEDGLNMIAACLRAGKARCGVLVNCLRGAPVDHTSGDELAARIGRSFATELKIGLRVLAIGGAVIGGWGALVPLSGAVVVPGVLVAETYVKKLQHPTGGVVDRIYVRDGVHVREGDMVLRLDETQLRSNYELLVKQLDQLRVHTARLMAERDGLGEPDFPRELSASNVNNETTQLLASERTLFDARASSRSSQRGLLRNHVSQLREQITGLEAQIKSKGTQIELITSELKGVQTLYDKQLVTLPRLTTLQREAARLDGERAQLVSAIAEAEGKISEAELQIVRVDRDFHTDVMKDLRESQDKQAEVSERLIAARDQLSKTDIRAPTSGVVHQLSAHTVRGVIASGEVIMEIVPDADELQIDAHLPPNEIDHVRVGQKSLVRFSAFNQRTTPQLRGVVSYVSADSTHDKQTNVAYYSVRVTLPADERRRLGGLQLVSGMPADVFLETGSRTMLSYLLKPMQDQLQRTFNEP